jgi:membrane-bound metal-dependent hydrolase YbcI (DUF457 family)
MPVTPFHFGPGALLKSVAPRYVSWTSFALANCLIDLEPISNFFLTGIPAHRFFHTIPGATLAALIAVWPGKILCDWWTRVWARWFDTNPTITWRQAVIGALLGGWTHIGLDMAMHRDVRPLWPFVDGNPFWGWIGVGPLHLLCVSSAVLALLVWGIPRMLRDDV